LSLTAQLYDTVILSNADAEGVSYPVGTSLDLGADSDSRPPPGADSTISFWRL